MVKRLIVGCMLLGCLGIAFAYMRAMSGEVGDMTYSSYHDGKRYDFHISRVEFRAAPSWRLWNDSPPLAPRKAENAAREVLTQTIPDSKKWWVDSITLGQIGEPNGQEWMYVVKFIWHNGVLSGAPAEMSIPVLMNGKAIVPKISAAK